MKHYAFFSQTGSEIATIARRLGRWPDKIITNQRPERLRTISPKLAGIDIIYLSNKPTVEEYLEVLGTEPCKVTLHGWLRIMPPEVIAIHPNMFNGHPGLITEHPSLKGKDPQEKAYNLGLTVSGCVLHQVTEGVDEGPILKERMVEIQNLSLDEVYSELHKTSIDLWVEFLK
jgi:folate-dependent phosphoribosylglycinamide formyltransferase PurN